MSLPSRAQAKAENTASEHSEKLEWLARSGYAAKGGIYIVIGVLATMAAFGSGGDLQGQAATSSRTSPGSPSVRPLLFVLGIGLAGYALWRFVQAALDPENKGSDKSGAAKRIAYVASGVSHVAPIGIGLPARDPARAAAAAAARRPMRRKYSPGPAAK